MHLGIKNCFCCSSEQSTVMCTLAIQLYITYMYTERLSYKNLIKSVYTIATLLSTFYRIFS